MKITLNENKEIVEAVKECLKQTGGIATACFITRQNDFLKYAMGSANSANPHTVDT